MPLEFSEAFSKPNSISFSIAFLIIIFLSAQLQRPTFSVVQYCEKKRKDEQGLGHWLRKESMASSLFMPWSWGRMQYSIYHRSWLNPWWDWDQNHLLQPNESWHHVTSCLRSFSNYRGATKVDSHAEHGTDDGCTLSTRYHPCQCQACSFCDCNKTWRVP